MSAQELEAVFALYDSLNLETSKDAEPDWENSDPAQKSKADHAIYYAMNKAIRFIPVGATFQDWRGHVWMKIRENLCDLILFHDGLEWWPAEVRSRKRLNPNLIVRLVGDAEIDFLSAWTF